MSPILARVALVRAATRTATQQQARHFSPLQAARNMARSVEAHPFERLPASSRPQAGDWRRLVKRAAGQALVFFPGFALVLGWPVIAKEILDGRV